VRWLERGYGRRLVVGSYVLLDRIGKGGMGYVFLARHRTFGRRAALKVVRPDRREDARVRGRFLREVRALGRLDHPNVVHAYDAGAAGRALYLAMEFVAGPDLGRVVAAGEVLAPGRAAEYARQAALGLQHMHDRGLVHRDVKPSNLSLADGGRVLKVLDVGLVKDHTAAEDGGLTRTGRLVGTADYAAPEQVTYAAGAGPPADQYALGCTLYHLLTGELPFAGGPPVARALRRVTEDAPPVGAKRPDLPPGLAAVVIRLLARHPGHRFPSARAVADALAPFATPLAAAADDTAVNLATLPDIEVPGSKLREVRGRPEQGEPDRPGTPETWNSET
jgi:serine/threonine-protein kinase